MATKAKSVSKSTRARKSSRALTVRRGLGTGGGRGLGTPNKVSAQAKDNILDVFLRIGGVPEMAKWARKNRGDFYTKIYARLIPKDVALGASEGLEDLLVKLAEQRGGSAPEPVAGEFTEIVGESADG